MAQNSLTVITRNSLVLLASLLIGACAGDIAGGGPGPNGRQDSGGGWYLDSGNTGGDPWGACTDEATCCKDPGDIECVGDPDSNPVCNCTKLWDCSKNPGKCEQDERKPPGGGSWDCKWTEQAYICVGGTAGETPPNGGGKWVCKPDTASGLWACALAFPPNPSNKPGGASQWNCTVENGKVVCERVPTTESNCTDGVDNDKDGKIDCDDPDCNCPPPPPPITKESDCKDGIDNDGDGKIDCFDPDCNCTPPPPPPKTESNCADGIDNDGDGKVDCADPDCKCPPPPPPVCPPGQECCDGIDNNGDGRIDEGNVCANVQEPCPPGAFQACDCYCGVHRKCSANGTWGPCKVDGNNTCQLAQVTSHSQCALGFCDYGKCVFGFGGFQCKHHTDCPSPLICDLGQCVPDNYTPCP